MSDEKICHEDYQKIQRNRESNTENQSISNELPDLDLRNKLNKNKGKPNIDKIVIECQSGEIDETEWRIGQIQIGNKQVFTSDDLELYKEYVQWDFINNKLYVTSELLLNIRTGKAKQEFTNTLQRWFIFITQDYNEVPKYEYFTILPNIQLEHPAAQFLRDAIIEKKFTNENDADDKMRKILGFISINHSQIVPHESADPLHVEHDPDRKIVVVNKFQSAEIPRVNLLVEKGGVIATACVLLRYESLGNGSYQWNDPEEVHKVLHDKFNVRYEGFASPVNSRFIEYDDSHFCSFFPETDEPFGSIGNFFHVDMKKHAGGWSLNPPFLNDLMKKVANRINEILDVDDKCYFFCTFPWWEDDEGWNILNDSRHLLRRFDLLPQHFTVQDAYGNKFEPKMKMNMFVMGELPSTVAKLIELGQELIINREDIKDHDIRVKLDENYKNCPW